MDILRILNNKKNSLNDLQEQRRKVDSVKEVECPVCHGIFPSSTLKEKKRICPDCGYYFSMTPKERIRMLADEGSFRLMNEKLTCADPLEFPEYKEKLSRLQEKSKQKDAVVTGVMKLQGISVTIGVMDYRFFMGSMGCVVGESITRLAEYAQRKKLPLVIFCLSGGARMQEGIFSLMQMSKTAAAIERFKESGGLYIPVLCNPTTGGVSASFAFLGDVILAEPKALIGFAGPRVIEQTIGQTLPEGFQRAESQLNNGMIDRIVERKELKEVLYKLLILHGYK